MTGEQTNGPPKIADSSTWVDLWRHIDSPQVRLLEDLVLSGQIATGDLILHEVLRGFNDDLQYARVRREMLRLEAHAMVSPVIALRATVNYRTLRRMGITVRKSIDCLIATFCIDNGIALLHSDRDFDPFEQHLGLMVVR